ncbi:M20 family metallopeptidase [Enteractinococcus fodinae]|uniref:Hippurate hydrolase n=1 Tax=Enteractinococcus fodinae TaxID=684663 RepID=A0ABU2AXN7_9MICC|nr:M20 family metallopeptidase [Enteractinococcus fodinae]MDR7346120.1 hippurate hydrolase [Enteractinococcus fodinae]
MTIQFLTDLDDLLSRLRDLYRELHQHPELSLEEHQTAERIESELSDLDVEVQRIGGTGVVAIIRNGDGPTVLARADTDALPVTEQTGLDYASKVDGAMHACGHDMHVTTLLGAVELLTTNKDAWAGTYIGLFQPAEETAQGAQAMLDDGLVDKIPTPEVALSQHVMPTEVGTIGTSAGPVLSAGDSLKITVHGRGAHGSMPHNSVDPVVLASSIVMRLQTIVSRETKPGEFAVVTVGALNAGSKSNIIADRAELLLNLRTYDTQVREDIMAAIERIVRAECQAAGSPQEPDFEYYDQFPLTDNDPTVNTKITEAFTDYFGSEAVYETKPYTASEDFSRIPNAFDIPYTYWFIGSVAPEKYQRAVEQGTVAQDIPANHSPFFAPEIDPTLENGIRTQVVAALAYLAQD